MPKNAELIKALTVGLWLLGGYLFKAEVIQNPEQFWGVIATALVNILAVAGTYKSGEEGRKALRKAEAKADL